MKEKILVLPVGEDALRIDIDIYGRSKCYLVKGGRSLYLGAGLIDNLARKILALLEEEAEGTRPVITLSEEHFALYFEGEGSERTFILRDAAGGVIARRGLTGPEAEKWREELKDQCPIP